MSSSGDPPSVSEVDGLPGSSSAAIGTMIVLTAVVVAAGLFLPHQAVWIDESTQLSGMTLSPSSVVRWLANPAFHDFGVPGDRMPPLSYWLGWTWSRVFGLNETSLRWFGVACTAVAAALSFSAGRLAFGARAGLCAGLFLALSPNVCVTAVEIRAYPLFLLTSAGAVRAWVLILQSPGPEPTRRRWIELAVWLIVGIYTHFFAMLLAGLIVLALGVDRLLGGRSLRPVVALAAAVGVAGIGIAPFVLSSVGMSPSSAAASHHLREVFQLIYRLVGHPATAVFPVVTALLFGSALLLVLAAAKLPPPRRRPFHSLALALFLGIAISGVCNFLVGGVSTAKVSYSTWAMPLVSLLLSASQAQTNRIWSRIALGAAIVFLLCEGSGIAQLARNGDYFAHGPQRRLQAVIDRLPSGSLAVVHAEPTDDYASVYFPLRFANGPALPQFVASESGVVRPLGVPLDLTSPGWDKALQSYSRLVVVRSKMQNARALADQIRHGNRPFAESRFLSDLESSAVWKRRTHELFVAFVAADVTVLERVSASSP